MSNEFATASNVFVVPKMRRIRNIHMVGIGGSGMSGVAEVLLNEGYQVSGSDLESSTSTERLQKLGAKINIGHAKAYVEHADVVVISSAITTDNPELTNAKQLRIPVVLRAEMLAELMRFRHGIAIAGSHGKTTTTSLVANLLEVGGLDPTFVVGGLIKSLDRHGGLGDSRYMVAEADESDTSFLHLQPMVAVITNIDREHLSAFPGGMGALDEVFLQFLHNLPFYGLAVLCGDDPGVKRILPSLPRKFLTYGFEPSNDFQAVDYRPTTKGCSFKVKRPDAREPLAVECTLTGSHNVLNTLAAIIVAMDEGVKDAAIVKALSTFAGVERRCELHKGILIAGKQVDLVDDYGHHPTELMVVIKSMREMYPGKRILMVFQLHRYSRTRDCYDDFVRVLCDVDVLIMLDVYAAGEEPVFGVDAHSLCASIRQRGTLDPMFAASMNEACGLVQDVVCAGDLVITQGAGDISVLKKKLLDNNEAYDNRRSAQR